MSERERDRHELYELAAGNRARIENLERELTLNRERVHEIAGELAALRYLGNKVGDMATALHELSGKLELISRRALERPTARTWQASASMLSAVVALIALIVALRH